MIKCTNDGNHANLEFSPEMVDAGMDILAEYDLGDVPLDELAVRIFTAMLSVSLDRLKAEGEQTGTDNVVNFPGEPDLGVEPNHVLMASRKVDLDMVLVLGYRKSGHLFCASSSGNSDKAIALMTRAKHLAVQASIEQSHDPS